MKKKVKLLYIEDGKINRAIVEAIKENVQDDYSGMEIKTATLSLVNDITPTHNIEKLTKAIRNANVIVFDYGGLGGFMGLSHALVDWWNRFFIKQVESYSNRDWRCISALDTFEAEDRELLESLGVQFKYK